MFLRNLKVSYDFFTKELKTVNNIFFFQYDSCDRPQKWCVLLLCQLFGLNF